MKHHFIEYTVERDDDDYDLDIEYMITPYYPATGPSFNSPGEPEEGGEIELCSVMHDGLDFITTPQEEMEIINWINNNHDPDDGEYGDG